MLSQAEVFRQQMSYLGDFMATAFIRRMLNRNTEHMYLGDLLTDCDTGCIFRIQDESGIHILPLVSSVSLLETMLLPPTEIQYMFMLIRYWTERDHVLFDHFSPMHVCS